MSKIFKRILAFVIVAEIAAVLVVLGNSALFSNAFAADSSQKNLLQTKNVEKCTEFITHAWQLNDSVHHYLEQSFLNGIGIVKFYRDIQPKLDSGKLVLVENNSFYITDTMRYSYPFLTPTAVNLLADIGIKFKEKIKNTNLKDARFVVSSMIRTVSSVSRLRKHNRNAIRHSAHLHGTTFDINYGEFDNPQPISEAEKAYLKECIAQSIFELRAEAKCWATYEIWQTCFHVVSR